MTENRTPIDEALACYGEALSRERKQRAPIGIAVGDVRDFTGRITEREGAPITQGAGLMVNSALAGLGPAIRIHERLDPRVAELELTYIGRQQLGDGRMHEATPGADPVRWVPYLGGSILQSDYYIVGGVTELNQNISTGAAEMRVSGVGPRARYVVINVAVDLRIVNSRNLVVHHATSLQKQVIGYEAGIDLFRFFGTRLFDLSGGTRTSEPMQMAVRSVLQLATLELLEAVSGVRNEDCVRQVQPDLERRQARPSEPPGSQEWPPDAETAVSAERVREAKREQQERREQKEQRAAATEQPQPQQQAVRPQPPPVQPAPSEPPRADTGAAVVGAATNAEAAVGLWARLREKHNDLFAGVQADVVSVNREGGPYLVVVQHPRTPAAEFCTVVQTVGVECAVAPPQVMAARAAAQRAPETR